MKKEEVVNLTAEKIIGPTIPPSEVSLIGRILRRKLLQAEGHSKKAVDELVELDRLRRGRWGIR